MRFPFCLAASPQHSCEFLANTGLKARRLKGRMKWRKRPAPYVHLRLAPIEHAATISSKPPDQMTDEELMAIIREGQAKEAEERKPSN